MLLSMLFRRSGRGAGSQDDDGDAPGDSPPLEMPASVEDEPAWTEPDAPRMRIQVQYRRVLAIVLVLAAILVLAFNLLGDLPADLTARWPWLLIIVGVVALLAGLVMAWPHGTLGGPVLMAVGVVALLDQAFVPAASLMLSGAVMVALGLAVIIRGLTMPRL